MMKSENWWQQF